MANISAFLQRILDAIYGEEVRGSIHDAIDAINKESSRAMETASGARDSAQSFANDAKSAASTVAQKAAEAQVSAGNAAVSEQNARVCEANATARATEAAASAASAITAANDATNSKTTAAEKAKDATDSAASAAVSALSAQQYSGKPPKPQNGTWHIWDASAQKYVNSGIGCELEGPRGIGVSGIELTKGNHKPGTTDTYTITLTDGTTSSISIYNGRNGTGAGDVLGVSFDLILPANGWTDGRITMTDSRLIAAATHKYLVDVYDTCRDEYIACNIRAEDITSTGSITFQNETDPTSDLLVNIIRLELAENGSE